MDLRRGAVLPLLSGLLLSGAGCGGDADAFTNPGPMDASVDAGRPGAPDAGASDTGTTPRPGKACPCTFDESFTDPDRMERGGTTARYEPSGQGTLAADAAFALENVGSGGEGALNVTGPRTLAAGEHQLSSLSITGAALQISGDTVLRVSGPVSVTAAGSLEVLGKLKLVVGGDLRVDCGRIISSGELTIHQPSGNVTVSCSTANAQGEIATDFRPTGSSGALRIWTRGSVTTSGSANVYTGSIMSRTDASGALEIRAYGDLNFGPGSGLVTTGGAVGRNGDLSIYTEGNVSVRGVRLAGGDSTAATAAGGAVTLRARGAVSFDAGGNLLSSPGGSVEVATESSLTIEHGSFILTPTGGTQDHAAHVRLFARALRVGSNGADESAVIARAGLRFASTLELEAVEGVQILGDATVGASPVTCLQGGDVRIRSEGGVIVGDRALVKAGDSRAGTSCAAAKGGALTILGAQSLSIPAAVANAGQGAPAGEKQIAGAQAVRLGLLSAELTTLRQATSVPLQIEGLVDAPTVSATTMGSTSPARYPGVHLALSRGSDMFQLVRHGPLTLGAGFRYRVFLEPRMFDAVSLDGFTIDYR